MTHHEPSSRRRQSAQTLAKQTRRARLSLKPKSQRGLTSAATASMVPMRVRSTVAVTREKDTAKREIRKIFDLQVLACEKGDLDALFQAMWNSPDLIAVMPDGTTLDYQGVKNYTAELFNSAPSVKFSRIKDDFRFLTKDLVLYAWNGKCDMTLRAGGHSRIASYAVTYLFRKIGKEWKIIFSHESASPALEGKPKK